jgi:predicted nucleic acid-binding protein
MSVFLDTGVLLGAVLPADPLHARSREALRRVARGELGAAHTSDYVVAEGLNYLRARVRRREPEEALLALALGSEDGPPIVATLHRIHTMRFARATTLYRKHASRGLSFTDCTTLALASERGLDQIATFDRGFRGLVGVLDV